MSLIHSLDQLKDPKHYQIDIDKLKQIKTGLNIIEVKSSFVFTML